MRRPSLAFTLPAVFALAACAAPTPPAEPEPEYRLAGTVVNIGDVPMPNVVTFVDFHPSIHSMALAEWGTHATDCSGVFLAFDSDDLELDGSFEWDLGDGSGIPIAYRDLASQAFSSPYDEVSCDLTASAAVQVLRVWVYDITLGPTGAIGTLSESTLLAGGIFYTDALSLVPSPTEPFRIGTWTFAAGDVTIQGECVFDDGMNPPHTVAAIDVELAAGWNPITAQVDPGAGLMTITEGTFEGFWLAFVPN